MIRPVSVLAIGTAVPPHILLQEDVARLAPIALGVTLERHPGLVEVFSNTGIDRRHIARPLDWFMQERDWNERTQAYLDAAGDLFVAAAEKALHRAGLTARDVDIVVAVSSTGIATPSLEARVAVALGLRSDVARVPLFGLGCAGGVTGLATAARLARAEPGKIVLMVAVELCTLAFRFDRVSKTDVIATALFADGAAAAVLRADDEAAGVARLGAAAEHMWPDTLDIMGWTVDPVGFGVVLSPALPRFLEEHLAAPARHFIKGLGLNGEKPQMICHLGSTKVLAAIETALALEFGTLADERAVLRQHGNMSSPSVLFVLEHALARGRCGPAVLAALGPGFTASFVAAELGRGGGEGLGQEAANG
jgi:alkylresorcinol/alkylpyrone synthase